jgi:outer membrane receptor protein involved in Fe transport
MENHMTAIALRPCVRPYRILRATPLFLALSLAFATAHAQEQPTPQDATAPEAPPASLETSKPKNLGEIDVVGKLDRSRNKLSPGVGASQYVFDQKAISQLPNGDATPLNQVLLRAPGVVEDSYGQLHIRGDHADVQYRINGVIVPESISGFGQTLDTRTINNVSLLTGALPAQFGYRTAGVIDITTKNGAKGNGGSVGINAGSFGTINPFAQAYGNNGRWNYFITANYLQDDLGIENSTASRNAIHDHTNQAKGFGYLSYLLTDSTRASFMFGATNNRFEIPNNPGQTPTFALNGVPAVDSSTLDARQKERTRFGILSLQGSFGNTDYQLSLGQRYTSVYYQPDPIGDLVFNGVAATVGRSNRANTLQGDFSFALNNRHTVRYGVYASDERPVSDNSSVVFPADADGNQTSDIPFTIVDNAAHIHARTYGVYLQDEYKPTDKLTINYGARADRVDAYVKEGQLSPRLGAVYQLTPSTTLHAGYARYFTPPPAELIAPSDIALFQRTTNQLPTNVNAQTLSERSHYFDAGISQKVGDHLTLGLDGYFRRVRNLLDEGQFGAALIFSPFNYDRGYVRGLEFTSSYDSGGFNAFLNVSANRAVATRVVTGQYNFDQDELDYIATHYVHLDHDQALTGSGGVSYNWNGTRIGADFLYGSGLRNGFANTTHLPSYYNINLSAEHTFQLGSAGAFSVRLAALNITDKVYQLRDGSGIGVGAPQFGARRGFYVGVSKEF